MIMITYNIMYDWDKGPRILFTFLLNPPCHNNSGVRLKGERSIFQIKDIIENIEKFSVWISWHAYGYLFHLASPEENV